MDRPAALGIQLSAFDSTMFAATVWDLLKEIHPSESCVAAGTAAHVVMSGRALDCAADRVGGLVYRGAGRGGVVPAVGAQARICAVRACIAFCSAGCFCFGVRGLLPTRRLARRSSMSEESKGRIQWAGMSTSSCFFAGAFLANFVPRFCAGNLRGSVPSPRFAKPPGRGLSSPVVNVLWALLNLVLGSVFFVWGRFGAATMWPCWLFRGDCLD